MEAARETSSRQELVQAIKKPRSGTEALRKDITDVTSQITKGS